MYFWYNPGLRSKLRKTGCKLGFGVLVSILTINSSLYLECIYLTGEVEDSRALMTHNAGLFLEMHWKLFRAREGQDWEIQGHHLTLYYLETGQPQLFGEGWFFSVKPSYLHIAAQSQPMTRNERPLWDYLWSMSKQVNRTPRLLQKGGRKPEIFHF